MRKRIFFVEPVFSLCSVQIVDLLRPSRPLSVIGYCRLRRIPSVILLFVPPLLLPPRGSVIVDNNSGKCSSLTLSRPTSCRSECLRLPCGVGRGRRQVLTHRIPLVFPFIFLKFPNKSEGGADSVQRVNSVCARRMATAECMSWVVVCSG